MLNLGFIAKEVPENGPVPAWRFLFPVDGKMLSIVDPFA